MKGGSVSGGVGGRRVRLKEIGKALSTRVFSPGDSTECQEMTEKEGAVGEEGAVGTKEEGWEEEEEEGTEELNDLHLRERRAALKEAEDAAKLEESHRGTFASLPCFTADDARGLAPNL